MNAAFGQSHNCFRKLNFFALKSKASITREKNKQRKKFFDFHRLIKRNEKATNYDESIGVVNRAR